ncbi:hypothetical protein [Carnobacterium divergens]|uniref:Uncharacterized protein n=1 Tax=Carnobacterium divergens DSM 20623 TaxID=1449336 RepID=A0A0R2HX85_CARDV|nr:hypothetical protein [Carnobacterium divergens]KRN57321.1 hypothetical protein IV74_GL000302 [Carnobacterium divergens DSM 20623]MDO0875356.1 hypothetical protein [Carnobacterium divergens]SUX17099.1 Uncharacterised protein [Carnobacterium divergens]
MSEISYLEAKELTLEDYEDFIEDEGFSPSQAIAATFEDSVLMMKKSHKVYVSVMINLSILSLKENFIPDYLLERQENLSKLEGLNEEEQSAYNWDINVLNQLLSNQNFEIDKDEEYRLRVNMLLG